MRIVHPRAGTLEFDRLRTFICEGKKNGWASGRQPTRMSSGELYYDFRMHDLLYTDTYLGEQGFLGREIVSLKGEPIWGMNYTGILKIPERLNAEVTPALFKAEINRFLREMLMKVSPDFPFRGPVSGENNKRTGAGYLSYQNTLRVIQTVGPNKPMGPFKGEEVVRLENREMGEFFNAFEFNYHGRLLVHDKFIQI